MKIRNCCSCFSKRKHSRKT